MTTPEVLVNDPSLGLLPNWKNVVEFIEDITYRIWEQGNLDLIKETYIFQTAYTQFCEQN